MGIMGMCLRIKFFCILFFVSAHSCTSQSYFDVSKDYPYKGAANYTINLSSLKQYTELEIQQVFNSIYKTGIEFNYPQGGCQHRAQIMSIMLTQVYKIEHCKVWIFSPSSLFLKDNRKLIIRDNNSLCKSNQVAWGYHVAPVVLVRNNAVLDTVVLDPSINSQGPMLFREWLKRMQNSDVSKYTFLNPDRYFFNLQTDQLGNPTNVISGYFYEYDQDAKDNLVLEKGLAINDMAIYVYKKFMKPLMCSDKLGNLDKLNDLKAIFGNATALDYLFSQNTSARSKVATQRYAISQYPEIMKDARDVFNDRLIYWTQLTNKLIDH